MNLLIEYYKPKNESRNSEYLFCIQQNILNDQIKKIYVFISDDSPFEITNSKVEVVKSNQRPTFHTLIDYCNQNLNGELCTIANTDIFFDESLKHLENFDFNNVFLALTRWDMLQENNSWKIRYYEFPWRHPQDTVLTSYFSQDAWMFKTPIKLDLRCDFLMGKPGCDNRISQILHENNYDVRNPSKLIIIKHLHLSGYRTYNNQEIVPGPYLLIKPTDKLEVQTEKFTIPHF